MKEHSAAARYVLSCLFLFFCQEMEFINECAEEMWEREREEVSPPLTWDHPPLAPHPPTHLPARPLSTSPPSFRPGPARGEETAAPSGIWHHNYIGSRAACCLLELGRLQPGHTRPLMCRERLVGTWTRGWRADIVGKVRLSLVLICRGNNSREWLPVILNLLLLPVWSLWIRLLFCIVS